MRVDKFLKNSRIIKRRSVAKEACDSQRVMVNGKAAKAGTELAVGDRIDIEFGNSNYAAKKMPHRNRPKEIELKWKNFSN